MEAEAPASRTRFFCHSCNREIDSISSDFKCPQCLDGFIEELPPESAGAGDLETGSVNDLNADNQVLRFANEIFSNPLLTPILMSSSVGARPGDTYGESSNDEASGRRRGYRRDYNITNFDTILQDILISVGGGEAPSLFFTGNPGDYAWGREGLDTIVTQLLNQMDNTGPPPLEKEKIDEIPNVAVEKAHVDAKLQCSVCWEDFVLNEPVRKLPCSHLYHENCIVPWLQCHGTCPICRKSLVSESGSEQQRNSLSAAAQAVANTIRNVTSVMRPSGFQNDSPSTSTAFTMNSQQDGQNTASLIGENSRSSLYSPPSSFLNPNTVPFPSSTGTQFSVSLNSAPDTTPSSTESGTSATAYHDRKRDDDGNFDPNDFD